MSAESITFLTVFGNISSLYAAASIFALTGIFPGVSLSLIYVTAPVGARSQR